ncbi:hypothetical protein BX600DRAFT_430511 [Xylariales sp. PMI_506]|nr:hypothetical protein BX600DRAFT_430511 [Xylariales sp. PMI_506]
MAPQLLVPQLSHYMPTHTHTAAVVLQTYQAIADLHTPKDGPNLTALLTGNYNLALNAAQLHTRGFGTYVPTAAAAAVRSFDLQDLYYVMCVLALVVFMLTAMTVMEMRFRRQQNRQDRMAAAEYAQLI